MEISVQSIFLIFKFLGKILCFYHLNKTCSVLVSHGLYLPGFFKPISFYLPQLFLSWCLHMPLPKLTNSQASLYLTDALKSDRLPISSAHWTLYYAMANRSLKCRLRVVPHFSSGIIERAKRERPWKSPHARKGGVILTRARVSLALLSLRKNEGLLVV